MVTTLPKVITRSKIALDEVNRTNGFTPRVQALKQLYLDARPMVSGERAWLWMESHKQTEHEHPAIRAAKAFRNVLEKMPIAIHEGEQIVGGTTQYIRGAHPRVETYPNAVKARAEAQKVTTASPANVAQLLPADKEKLIAAAEYWIKFWTGKVPARNYSDDEWEVYKALAQSRMSFSMSAWEGKEANVDGAGTTGIAPGADHEKAINKGFNGIIAEAKDHIAHIESKSYSELTAEDEDKLATLKGIVMALEAMITFAHRHAVLARELAAKEKDAQRKKELLKVADVCENVPANPARDFQEAMQTHWFILIGQDIEKTAPNAYCGRFDQYCYPCYEKDIKEGRLTRQEAAELMGCMFIKWQTLEAFSQGDFHLAVPGSYLVNVTLGGVNRSGKDASNELSCLVLHVAAQTKTNQPHISLRYHRAMAPELFDKAVECTRDHGAGIPAWFSDRHGIEYLCDRGIPHEEARDWSILGCINIAIGNANDFSHGGGHLGFVNHPKILEVTLNNGIEPKTGVRLGPETGDPRDFKRFDDLVEAYRKQIDHYYDANIRRARERARQMQHLYAYVPFISSLTNDCIKRGKDVNHGGSKYWFEHLGATFNDRGLPDVTDSMMAIKKVVFEGGVPMGTLLDALKADWAGYDELRQKCQAVPRYGNDDDEADSFMAHFWRYTLDLGFSYKDIYGRRPMAFRQGAGWAQWAGKAVGALPNGRKAWTALADAAASPCQGADLKGPTAVMNSVTKLDNMYLEGPLLNMKFAPGPLRTREGRMKFGELIATYFDKGGFQVQFTILDRDTLLDAQKHPQKYRNLVVRVAGYSAFWVELPADIQNEIISRTEHQI